MYVHPIIIGWILGAITTFVGLVIYGKMSGGKNEQDKH